MAVRVFFFTAFASLLFSCQTPIQKQKDIFSLSLISVDGKTIDISEIKKNRASAFVFLSPDCPLSQKYSLPLKKSITGFADKRIGFYLVFPGTMYSAQEIRNFITDYALPVVSIADHDKKLMNILGASVTPEVFLVNSSGEIVYRGAIDNWFVEVGKQKEIITEHYLSEAIESVLANKPVKVSRSKAVGCIIE